MPLPDKRAVVDSLLSALRGEIAVLARAAQNTREAATHEEAKPENDKDTRSIEAAYLAGAQAERVRELERLAQVLSTLELRVFGAGDPITAAALVELSCEGGTLCCLLAPQGGGRRATVAGVEVQVVTPPSPLGRELLGKSTGDVLTLTTKGRPREYEIVDVC
jgi:hypothetical protein